MVLQLILCSRSVLTFSHQSVCLWHTSFGVFNFIFQTEIILFSNIRYTRQDLQNKKYANSVLGGFSLQVPGHTKYWVWLKFSVSLWWPEHVPLSPPIGRSWCCRLWWSGCAWLWFTPNTDAASLWTAMMSGRLPDCCCLEWTVSPASSGTAVSSVPAFRL